MNRIGRLIIPVILALFLSGCQDQRAKTASLPSPELEQEEYNVYSFLLNRSYDAKENDITIISDSTVPIRVVEMPYGGSFSNIFRTKYYIGGFHDEKIYITEIGEDTLEDFEQKNQHPPQLDYKFDIKRKYLLFSHEDYMDMNPQRPYWYEYYSQYPYSGGITSFSRVGFNRTRDKAVIYQNWWGGSMAGGGGFFLLYKVNDVWILKKTISLWIS